MEKKPENKEKKVIIETFQQKIIDEFPKNEKDFIVSVLYNTNLIDQVIKSKLKPSDFESFKAGLIFKGILDLHAEKLEFNCYNLKEILHSTILRNSTSLEIVGGSSIIDIIYEIPQIEKDFQFSTKIKRLAQKIKNSNLKNKIADISLNLIKKLKNLRASPVDIVKKSLNEYITQLDNFDSNVEDDQHNIKSHLKTISHNIRFKDEEKQRYFGLDMGYPIFSNYLDGLQNEIYVIAGPSSSGKTSFLTQLAYQITTVNDDATILYFSLDQSVIDITAKLIAIHGKIPVDYAKNPLIKDIKMEKTRRDAMAFISELKDRFYIFDQGNGEITLEDIDETIKEFRESPSTNIVVIIDPIFSVELQNSSFNDRNEFLWFILKKLKILCHSHKVSIILSMNTSCESELRRPTRKDLFKYDSIFHEPYAIFLLYNEYSINQSTPFLEYEWESEDVMIPISELNIIKNKMRGHIGRIFFKYYNSISSYKECVELEIDNYNEMIVNIDEYKLKSELESGK
ncbi:AAA family ATPase [bacterium]|nr:AAA family ATPase [bacterium]